MQHRAGLEMLSAAVPMARLNRKGQGQIVYRVPLWHANISCQMLDLE